MPATLLNQLENTLHMEKEQLRRHFSFWGSAAGRVLLLVSQQQKLLFWQGGCKKWRQVDQGIANTDSKQNIFSQVFKKAKQPRNAKSTPNFKPWKVATPGTFIDTSEDLSDHDEGNKAFDKDVEEGDDDEAEARNMNDGFIANSSYEQELAEKESTTLGDETLDTLYFDASLWMRSYDNKWNMFNIFLCASDLGKKIHD